MSPGVLRSVQIPESSVTIKTSVIDMTTIHSGNLDALYEPPIPGVEKVNPVPCLSFLLEHPSGQKLLFDLGVPKDIDTLGPEVANRLRAVGHQVHVERDVADELERHGIKRDEINAVIWSHTHWDHKGDVATFPSSTTLVLGPGAMAHFGKGGGNSGLGGINDRDIEGRKVQEIDFDGPQSLRIGAFRAFDYFNDGSMFLVDTPGHSIGHLGCLVRTTATPQSFMFFTGDCAHHCAEVRPSEYLPLPEEITPHPFASAGKSKSFCPGTALEDLNRSRGRDPYGPLWQPKNGPVNWDYDETLRTIEKVQVFDGEDDILVLLAHDGCVKRVDMPKFPQSVNDWRKRGLKEELTWNWLIDMESGLRPYICGE